MGQNSTNSQQTRSSQAANSLLFNNSLEALKNSRAPIISPDRMPPQFAEMLRKKELAKKRVEEFHRNYFNSEQQRLYSAKDKKVEQELEAIRAELEELSKSVKKFNQGILKAVSSPIIQPQSGVYYKSVFAHIREVIALLKLQVNEANSWLAVYKTRSKKKGHYWQQAKTGGAQYMFSEERGLATSVG